MTQMTRHSDQLYLTEQELAGVSVRGAVVLGSETALVWDTLILPAEMTPISDLCKGKKLIVVYSHADWDHVWGTCALPYDEVIAQKRCAERFADEKDVLATLQEYQAKYPAELSSIQLIAPTRTFEETLTLELGQLSVGLYHLPGHTLDGIVAFIPELGVFLGGDAIETPLPLIHEDSPVETWLRALERWAKNPALKTAIPSHGEIGGRGLLEYNISYLKAMLAGLEPEIPYELDDFYRKAHEDNRRYRG